MTRGRKRKAFEELQHPEAKRLRLFMATNSLSNSKDDAVKLLLSTATHYSHKDLAQDIFQAKIQDRMSHFFADISSNKKLSEAIIQYVSDDISSRMFANYFQIPIEHVKYAKKVKSRFDFKKFVYQVRHTSEVTISILYIVRFIFMLY